MLGTEGQATIRQMVDYLGEDMTLREVVGDGSAGYDPSSGTIGTTSNDDQTVRAVLVQYSERLVDGQNILRGDRRAIISSVDGSYSALSPTPEAGHQLIGVADRVNIIDVRTVRMDGSSVVYVCQVRE